MFAITPSPSPIPQRQFHLRFFFFVFFSADEKLLNSSLPAARVLLASVQMVGMRFEFSAADCPTWASKYFIHTSEDTSGPERCLQRHGAQKQESLNMTTEPGGEILDFVKCSTGDWIFMVCVSFLVFIYALLSSRGLKTYLSLTLSKKNRYFIEIDVFFSTVLHRRYKTQTEYPENRTSLLWFVCSYGGKMH